MWALEPLFVSEVNRLPIFELLAIIFFSSFAITSIRITYKRRWKRVLSQPVSIWLFGIIGICFSDFGYIYGSQYAPIAHVELIDYLWPSFAILFTSMLPREKFTWNNICGAILGFAGIYVLVHPEVFSHNFNSDFIFGYGLALIGAAIWGGYCAFTRHNKHIPTEMVGMYCGVGSIMCLILHLKFETFVMPTAHEASFAALTGITGAGLAYQLWDYGVKHGNVYLLGVLTYAARLGSMALLVLFGKEPLTINLVFACLLGTVGVLISTMDIRSLNPLRLVHYIRYGRSLKQNDTLEDEPSLAV